jgi:tRNA (mo5U34)-methyltransferase
MNVAMDVWTNPEWIGAGPEYPAWRWDLVAPLLPEVNDKKCLDVGCSSGFFSLKLKELGASAVLGIDQGEQARAIEQARLAAESLRLDVSFQELSVYDVGTLSRDFDVVLFLGVFYHLRHPLLALEQLRTVCSGQLLLQTITTPHDVGHYQDCPSEQNVDTGMRSPILNQPDFPLLRFVQGALDGDPSCWFVPSPEAVLAMLRSCGFEPERMIFPTPHEMIVRARAR